MLLLLTSVIHSLILEKEVKVLQVLTTKAGCSAAGLR